MAIHTVPSIQGVTIPDSTLGRAITEFVRDTESELLFNHSSRVYFFGALAGQQRGLAFDAELLYAATMFHDVGLMPSHSSPHLRFEVDGANAARDFLASHKVDPADIDKVWAGIALHTTPGVPEFMHPVIALTTAGVEMDVLGLTYDRYGDEVREAIVAAFPRTCAVQGRHHPGLLRRYQAQARHDLRQRQGRRHRRQATALSPGQLLLGDPRLALGRMSSRESGRVADFRLWSTQGVPHDDTVYSDSGC